MEDHATSSAPHCRPWQRRHVERWWPNLHAPQYAHGRGGRGRRPGGDGGGIGGGGGWSGCDADRRPASARRTPAMRRDSLHRYQRNRRRHRAGNCRNTPQAGGGAGRHTGAERRDRLRLLPGQPDCRAPRIRGGSVAGGPGRDRHGSHRGPDAVREQRPSGRDAGLGGVAACEVIRGLARQTGSGRDDGRFGIFNRPRSA